MIGERYFLDKKEKRLIDYDTGEIYTEKEEIIEWLENRKHEKQEDKSLEKDIRQTFDLPTALELYQQKWKEDSWFIKIYRTERRKSLKQAKLSVNASALLLHMEGYLEYKTNRVATKSGKKLSNKDLQNLVGLSPVTLKKALNELEEKLIIKRVGKSQEREIYINPYLMCAGNQVSKEVEKMFSEYDPLTPY